MQRQLCISSWRCILVKHCQSEPKIRLVFSCSVQVKIFTIKIFEIDKNRTVLLHQQMHYTAIKLYFHCF